MSTLLNIATRDIPLRKWSVAALAAATLTVSLGPALAQQAKPSVTTYKSASCGCCAKWVDHMRANGFEVTAHNVEDMDAVKEKYGVPAKLGSCHTSLVGGYVVEGHVPADVVKRLLAERPKVVGLSVPGMPASAPGMDIPGLPYTIVGFDKAGKLTVYERR
jgi:hypothetical protein